MKLSAPKLLFLGAAMAAVLAAAASPLAEQSWADLQATKATRAAAIEQTNAQVTQAQNDVEDAELKIKVGELMVEMIKATRKGLKEVQEAYEEYPQVIADAQTAFEELRKALDGVSSGDTDQQAELQTLKTGVEALLTALDALAEAWANEIPWDEFGEKVKGLGELVNSSLQSPEAQKKALLDDPKIIGALSRAFASLTKCWIMGEAVATDAGTNTVVAEKIAAHVAESKQEIRKAKDELTKAQQEAELARQSVPTAEEAVRLAQENLQLVVEEENARSAAAAAAACIAGL